MNKGAGLTIGVIAVAVAAGSGYWLGGRGGASHGDAAQVASAPAEPAKKEKKLLFYRNPMGLPDTSPLNFAPKVLRCATSRLRTPWLD